MELEFEFPMPSGSQLGGGSSGGAVDCEDIGDIPETPGSSGLGVDRGLMGGAGPINDGRAFGAGSSTGRHDGRSDDGSMG
jgi:hypothetical protein